jgi:hypothetical protein
MIDLIRMWFAQFVLKLFVAVYPKHGTERTGHIVLTLLDSMREDAVRAHRKVQDAAR